MTRKKIKLELIVNDAARKASLKKRRLGLLKKVSELSTLCGVNAFIIIYSPEEIEPMIWPSRLEVVELVNIYENMPELERSKKMMNQESYLKERISKVHEQWKRAHKKNREIQLIHFMCQIKEDNEMDGFSVNEVQLLIWLLEERMRDIKRRAEYLQQFPPIPVLAFPVGPPFSPQQDLITLEHILNREVAGVSTMDSTNNEHLDASLWEQWFSDLIENTENIPIQQNIATSSIAPMIDMGLQQTFNISTTVPNSGVDMVFPPAENFGEGSSSNIFNQLKFSPNSMMMGINPFEVGLPPLSASTDPFAVGLQPFEGDLADVRVLALPALNIPHITSVRGTSIGTDLGDPYGFFSDGSDIGLPPLDPNQLWPDHNFSL